eukprot:gene12329-gene10031
MSARSNSTSQTPLPTFISCSIFWVRRSNSLTSPLSKPAQRTRSSGSKQFPNRTVQQSRAVLALTGWRSTTGFVRCRVSHILQLPSRLPVAISGGPE